MPIKSRLTKIERRLNVVDHGEEIPDQIFRNIGTMHKEKNPKKQREIFFQKYGGSIERFAQVFLPYIGEMIKKLK